MEIILKRCSRCSNEYTLDCFNKRGNQCKFCHRQIHKEYRIRTSNISDKKYEKTLKGFAMRMYRNMQSRVTGIQKTKFYLYEGKELLDRQQYYDWILNNHDYKTLFKAYEASNYDRKLAPSVDRIDSNKGYTLDNMRIITHSMNSYYGSLNQKNVKKYK